GGMGGAMAGASLGAAMGSFVPVIGTAIGGLAGAVIGGLGGESVGEWFGGLFGSDKPKPGDSIKKSNESPASHVTKATVAANQVRSQAERSKTPPSTFAPVFHITGDVSNEQIQKLEAMVIRVKKQLDRQSRSGGPAFAD
ncbi:hypothetical protein JS87_24215, partial [Vibrio vulnificus]